MNEIISYSPVVCTMKSCAFPTSCCKECLCNKSLLGKRAIMLKDPKKNYQFVHQVFRPKAASHEK